MYYFSEEANVLASALGLYLGKSSRPTGDFLGGVMGGGWAWDIPFWVRSEAQLAEGGT